MPTCSETRITQFLKHELTEAEHRAFEQHLESCSQCCNRLHASTADASWWDWASEFLPDAADDLEPLTLSTESSCSEITSSEASSSEISDRATAKLGRHVALDSESSTSIQKAGELFHANPAFANAGETNTFPASVQNVLQLLNPTDDPQMLGRLGGYEIAGVVGAGGMGVVLKAWDRSLNRFVAIKVLAPHLATGGAARKRFAREAQAAAAVVHENVIAIHGVDEALGLPYLVMPYVKGESLQRRLNLHGPLQVAEVLRIACQTAAGLSAAHAQGLIHRDVKPGNILLADGVERVTITDFGLARAADDASLTCSGTIAGTPQYMSPEQARGETVDYRTDLFSLGSVIYAMCTGRPPFRAESSYGVLRRITDARPRAIQDINAEIPSWLVRLVDRLHAKSPDERYASSAEVAVDLEQCLAHLQQPTREPLPASVMAAMPRPFGIGRTVIVTLVVIAVLTAGVMLVAEPDDSLSQATTPSAATSEQGPLETQPVETQRLENLAGDSVSEAAPVEALSSVEAAFAEGLATLESVADDQIQAVWQDGTDDELQELHESIRQLEAELDSEW